MISRGSCLGAIVAALALAGCDAPERPGELSGSAAAEYATAPAVDPTSLQIGRSYLLSAITPVTSSPDPGDPTMTMLVTTPLPPETLVLVSDRLEAAGALWYEVHDREGDELLGWISVPGLGDQRIVELRPE